MLIDKNLILSNAKAVTTTAIDLDWSLNTLTPRDLWAGGELEFAFNPVTGPAGGTSIDFQIVASSKPITFQPGAAVTVTSAAPGVFTLASHGMVVGTPFYLSGGTAPTGLTNGTVYYASNITTNTFTASSTLANALAGTGITTSSTGTSVVIDPYAVIVGSSKPVPIAQFTGRSIMVKCTPTIGEAKLVGSGALAYSNVRVTTNPGSSNGDFQFLHARYVCSGTFSGTAFTTVLVLTAGTAPKYYPTSIVVA